MSQSLSFNKFATISDTIESTGSTISKTEYIVELLQHSGESAGITARFVMGNIFPDSDDRTVSVGNALLYKSLASATTHDTDEIEEMVADVGDLGLVCEQLTISQDSGQLTFGSSTLTVSSVYETFNTLASIEGAGSQQRKIDTITALLYDASSIEAKYIIRLLLGTMRIGVGSGLVRDAIAEAFNVNTETVKRGIMVSSDIERVALAAQHGGEEAVSSMSIQLGTPIKPMLAQKGTREDIVQNPPKNARIEWKYDGARLQCHIHNDTVQLFTRRMNEVTESMPDVCTILQENVSADTAIIDCEVVAYEPNSTTPKPFQEVMKRLRRKYDVTETAQDITLDVHAFDILHRNGEDLIDYPLTRRREYLTSTVKSDILANSQQLTTIEDLHHAEHHALQHGHEGIMLKKTDSSYQPDNRGKHWLKIKPEAETLDCVVIGGEWGEGKRSDMIGTFMLAVHDTTTNEFKSIGKVATGFTEKQLKTLTKRFKPLITHTNGKTLSITPKIVFEVATEEIQPSPQYDSGYGLRFPRFITVREDKTPTDTETLTRINQLYKIQ